MPIQISDVEVPLREPTEEEEEKSFDEPLKRYCSGCHMEITERNTRYEAKPHTLDICLENVIKRAALYPVMDDPEFRSK